MKLKNKKTGEIVELDHISAHYSRHYDYGEGKSGEQPCSTWNKTLAELNEEWEDYEEPDEIWYIDWKGDIRSAAIGNEWECEKEIGNYFETEEEAEKAVEKLKAWKRMEDTGCKPITWKWKQDYPNDACYVEVVLKCQFDSGVHDRDLDLLFGGENE